MRLRGADLREPPHGRSCRRLARPCPRGWERRRARRGLADVSPGFSILGTGTAGLSPRRPTAATGLMARAGIDPVCWEIRWQTPGNRDQNEMEAKRLVEASVMGQGLRNGEVPTGFAS